MKPKVVFLVGPTGVGKTDAAIKLARRLKTGIISCDSMQIYKGMDIITSKPAAALRRIVPHALVDIISPSCGYDVSRFRKDALQEIAKAAASAKTAILVGGTGLYMSVLLDGIFEFKGQDEKFRRKLYKEGEKRGSPYLYKRLKKCDPLAAAKIHPNDLRRIVRALEVFTASGKPISQWQKERKGIAKEYDVRIFCLDLPRDELYARIDRRVDKMLEAGLLKEVKGLLKKRLSRQARVAIGLREIVGYFKGEYSLDEARELMKQNTRRYAKRQLTWFRKDKRIEWIKISAKDSPSTIAKKVWCAWKKPS